jgi:uncharacterized membrane protein
MGAGHGHDGAALGTWREGMRRPMLRATVLGIVVCALATVAGLVVLWPDGSGSDEAREAAATMGLASERLTARVESVTDKPCTYGAEDGVPCRTIVVIPLEGPDEGALVSLGEFSLAERRYALDLDVGATIVVGYEPGTDYYFYADQDRRQPLLILAALFAVVVVALARFRGVLALAAMALTVVLLLGFVAPSVLDGNDPLLVCVVAASAIAFTTLYFTHGFSPATTVALAGTLASLALTLGISMVFFELAEFSGLATEAGLTLPFLAEGLDLQALLLGGAILGALGALDDVTVTQAATVAELHHRNPALRRRDLLVSGLRVGREHIAATVNTLLLAYVGASLSLILLFAVTNQSMAMIANSEVVAVEIARTLCGSIGLVAAVPITTAMAAALVSPASRRHAVDPVAAVLGEWSARPARAEAHPDDEATKPRWDDFRPPDDLVL